MRCVQRSSLPGPVICQGAWYKLIKRVSLAQDISTDEKIGRGADILSLFRDQDALVWEVQPHDGRPSFDCDLTEFAVGSTKKDITPRPEFIHELAPAIRVNSVGKPKSSVVLTLVYLRQFWRFLDRVATVGTGEVTGYRHVTHAHGQLYKTWLLQDLGLDPSSAKAPLGAARYLISDVRRRKGMEKWRLLWPTIEQKRGTEHKDVDPAILRPLYSILKARHAASGRAIREGAELMGRGIDPRLVGNGNDVAAWSDEASVAVLAREYLGKLLAGWKSSDAGMPTRFRFPPGHGLPIHGPSSVPVHKRTPVETVRWFVPDFEDAAASYLLAMLHLGWNPETVSAIDTSSDAAWCDWRLGAQGSDRTGTVAIYGHKSKVGKEQVAFSLSKPSAHPYQVVRSMTERTEPLRSALRARLVALGAVAHRTVGQRREAEAIERMVNSPWLFFSRRGKGPGGRVGCIVASPFLNAAMRSFCWAALKAALRMHRDEPRDRRHRYLALMTLTPSDLRDGFAAFLYDNSLYNTILVKQALGHTTLRTTRHYLRQRAQIAQRFKEFTGFQEQFFDEICRFRQVDPTILYLRARFGEVTDEQRRRLTDHRMRTRVGMGCLDPTHPPSDLAPDHRGGLCPVQRCTLCRHGVLFEDSLPGLAVRMAELRFIRSRASAERFTGSSFQTEWMATEYIVSHLYPGRSEEFAAAADLHLLRLQDGQAYLFDQIPPLFFEEMQH